MPYNPYVPSSNYQPVGRENLNAYLNKYYKNGLPTSAPTGAAPQPAAGGGGISTDTAVGLGTAALGMTTDYFTTANQSLGIDTQAPEEQRSATGQPIYNTGAFYNPAVSAKPQGATAGEALGGGLKAASAVAATANPFIIGGAFLAGTLAGVFGGRRRKKKQEAEKRRAMALAQSSQDKYNETSVKFDEQQIARAEYNKRRNMTNRLYNLYNTPQTIGY